MWACQAAKIVTGSQYRNQTTTNLSPEEVHEMGLRNVAEIEGEMLKIARQQGFSDIKSF